MFRLSRSFYFLLDALVIRVCIVFKDGYFFHRRTFHLVEFLNIKFIDDLWKTQIQKFKTPKQAIKFVKTINQTFKFMS